jgi:hypothetical protein
VASGSELLTEFIESSGIEADRLLGERHSMATPPARG